MPVAKGAPPSEPDTTTAPAAPADPVGASSSPAPAPAGESAGGVYEYTAPFATVYHLPLTAHPLIPAVEATDEDPGSPEVPATIFDWPDGPPPDGRWAKSRKKPNQLADNDQHLMEV